MSSGAHAANRWSVFFTGVERQLVAGVLAVSYGATYVVLLERDSQHSWLDLAAFICFAGILVVGVMNVVRGLPSLRTDVLAVKLLACALCAGSWIYTSLAAPGAIGGGEALFYGVAAAGALAAWVDAHRTRSHSRWSVVGPVGLFALWSIAQALSGGGTFRYAAVVASISGLALIGFLERQAFAS